MISENYTMPIESADTVMGLYSPGDGPGDQSYGPIGSHWLNQYLLFVISLGDLPFTLLEGKGTQVRKSIFGILQGYYDPGGMCLRERLNGGK